MKFASCLVACLAAAGSAVAQRPPPLAPLTTTGLQNDIRASKLRFHANSLQSISLLSGRRRSHGSLGYNASVAYIKGLLDLTGFYDTQLQPVTSSELNFKALTISDSTPTTYTGVAPIFGSPAGLVTATLLFVSDAGCASVSVQVTLFR